MIIAVKAPTGSPLVMPIKETDLKHQDRHLDLHNSEDIKAVKYRQVEVGSSVLSMYYDISRDLDMANWDGFIAWALPLIENICDFVDYVYQLFEELKPDQVLIYNGRLFENRLFYDIAKSMGTFCRRVAAEHRTLRTYG